MHIYSYPQTYPLPTRYTPDWERHYYPYVPKECPGKDYYPYVPKKCPGKDYCPHCGKYIGPVVYH